MMQLTPQMKILVCVEPVDFRAGIDGLCRICRQALSYSPVLRSRSVPAFSATRPDEEHPEG